MKISLIMFLFSFCLLKAQTKVEKIEVSPNKNTQVIFASEVKNKEPGNGIFAVLEPKQGDSRKIIRVQYDDDQAEDYTDETNLQVETIDGNIYDLTMINTKKPKKTTRVIPISAAITNVNGSVISSPTNNSNPQIVGVKKAENRYIHHSDKSKGVNEKEFYKGPDNSLYLSNKKEYLKAISEELTETSLQYSRFKSTAVSQQIELTIKGIYTNKDELYFVFNLKNNGTQPYDIIKTKMFRASTKLARKLKTGDTDGQRLYQPLPYKPELEYNLLKRVNPDSDINFTIVVSKFTIGKDKAVYFDIDERNGAMDVFIPIFYNRVNEPINYN
ncbi:DUF4138 domain-containing protein (plasmid) [Aquimarina sp. TRL1]|uniref:DUF4138 domain-containing protein n=1 Tax=Aquimarina sp. (strain TRL1) TaxID=2736252 RepID=UPI00158B09E7|nr:DUF4138 domain-containing protein [Aquimarina sp. TRL1]QKX07754.1 DUF4138 domain-containing protein [Aquimarina sp. TRL1]